MMNASILLLPICFLDVFDEIKRLSTENAESLVISWYRRRDLNSQGLLPGGF